MLQFIVLHITITEYIIIHAITIHIFVITTAGARAGGGCPRAGGPPRLINGHNII